MVNESCRACGILLDDKNNTYCDNQNCKVNRSLEKFTSEPKKTRRDRSR